MGVLTDFLKLFKAGVNEVVDVDIHINDNYDKINNWAKTVNTSLADKEPKIIKKSGFNLAISDLVNSTSSIILASAKAVKTAYDKAVSAFNLATTNKKAILNQAEQIENLVIKWTDLGDKNSCINGSVINLAAALSSYDFVKFDFNTRRTTTEGLNLSSPIFQVSSRYSFSWADGTSTKAINLEGTTNTVIVKDLAGYAQGNFIRVIGGKIEPR